MSKRGNGEGTIYQRSDGRWMASFIMPNGKRKDLYGKSRKEAAAKLHDAQSNSRKGLSPTGGRESVAQYLSRWLKDVAANRVRTTTLRNYERDVNRYIIPAIGRLRLPELTAARVQAFVNDLTAAGLGPQTVRHVHAVLRAALQRAVKEGLTAQNVAKLVDTPRVARRPVPVLSSVMARAILAAFVGHDLETLVALTLSTGLRQGEALGLAWDDVDLEAGTLTVRRQLQRIDGAYQLTEPKSAQSRRALVLPPLAIQCLRLHRSRQTEARLRLGQSWGATGRIFTTATGGYANGSTVTHRFQKQLRKSSLEPMAWHHLRHGSASLLLAQGASMRVVMEQLGHSQISLTMNTYAHVAPTLMMDAALKLEQALTGAG